MFGNAWRVGRIAGVEIRIDSSWVVAALLIIYSLYVRLTIEHEGLETASAISLAIGSAVLFFGSVLTHEMAHSLMARRRGIPVRGITLFLFGGATHARVDSKGPGDELVISVVGPVTSVLVAVLFGAIAVLGQGFLAEPVAGTFGYLAWVNLVLAVFNLVPGFPLDGGRVLRALVWRATGSLPRATHVASVAGQLFGFLLVASGVWFFAVGLPAGGIWFAAIGWFLIQAARASYREVLRSAGESQSLPGTGEEAAPS